MDTPTGEISALLMIFRDSAGCGPHIASNFLLICGAVSLAGLLFLMYDALGARILGWLFKKAPRGAVRASAPFMALAAASSILLGEAALGLLNPVVVSGTLGILFLLSFQFMPASAAGFMKWAGNLWTGASPGGKTLLLLVLCTGMPFLASPELNVDCMEYCLAYPQHLLMQHRILGYGAYQESAFGVCTYPLLVEFNNIFPLLFGLDSAAKILRPVFAVAGALALLGTMRISMPGIAGLGVAWAAVALSPLRFSLVTAKNDAVITGWFLVLAAVILESVRRSRRIPGGGRMLVLGIMAGSISASKYVIAFPATILLLFALFRRDLLRRPGSLLVLACGILLPISGWLARDLFIYGDPVYPFGKVVLAALSGNVLGDRVIRDTFIVYTACSRVLADIPEEFIRLALPVSFPLLAALPFMVTRRMKGGFGLIVACYAGFLAILLGVRGMLEVVERYSIPAFAVVVVVSFAVVYGGAWGDAGIKARPRWAYLPLAVLLVVIHLRLVGASASQSPAITPAAFFPGGMAAGEFREKGLCAYGAILPGLRKTWARPGGGGNFLSIGGWITWGIPSRVLLRGMEQPFIWRAIHDSGSTSRVGIKFRQADVRWIFYNALLANWYRTQVFPDEWTPRMLRLYRDFASRCLRLESFSGRVDPPAYGSPWLFRVLPRRGLVEGLLFLPGIENAFTPATTAGLAGKREEALAGFSGLRRDLPNLAWIDAMEAEVLLAMGRNAEAYRLAKLSTDAGLVFYSNHLVLGIAAARTGRREEAEKILDSARRYYPLWPNEVETARNAAGLAPRRPGVAR